MSDSSDDEEEDDEDDEGDDDESSDNDDDDLQEFEIQQDNKEDEASDDDEDAGDAIGDAMQQVNEMVSQSKSKLLIWVPHLRKHMHRAAVVADLAMGGGRHYLSADRTIRAKATKQRQEEGKDEDNHDLQHYEWMVGIGTDIAAKIGDEIEVGRVIRITAKNKGVDYKKPVRLSSKEDREKAEKVGVKFHCHWFIKPKRGEPKDIYTFGVNPFTVAELKPSHVVSPVVLEHQRNKKWKMSGQSMKIIMTQKRGNDNIWVPSLYM